MAEQGVIHASMRGHSVQQSATKCAVKLASLVNYMCGQSSFHFVPPEIPFVPSCADSDFLS